jgi:hypothetical protein
MTLSLSVITPRYAMQASDRRVVRMSEAGQVTWVDDDERNKAVFVAERLSFAYTGHAEIADQDTAEFFQGVMAERLGQGDSVEQALAQVGDMSAGYLRSLRPHTDKHHAFVGVGWETSSDGERTPVILWASNAMTASGAWLDQPEDGFKVQRRVLEPGEPSALVVSGAPVPGDELMRLNAQIAFLAGSSDDPAPVGRALIEAIRARGDEDDRVGTGVMLNCLPQSPGPPGGDIFFVTGEPKLDVRTFTYVPADTVLAFEYLGPLVASSDGVMLGGFGALGAEAEGTTGFMYRPSSAAPPPRAAVGQRIRQTKVGRNEPCWCGSGEKYKRCHGR